MDSRKRKREDDPPRITFVTPSRTFERLFKETSLEALTAAVSKKLGVDAGMALELTQLRGGMSIDLEDEDDFDALRSYALSSGSVEISVAFRGMSKVLEVPQQPEVHEQVMVPSGGPSSFREKRQETTILPSTIGIDLNTTGASSSTPALPSSKKDKSKSEKHESLAIATENRTIPVTGTESPEKPKSTRKKAEKSVAIDSIPSASAIQIEEPRSDEITKKKRKKQKRVFPETTISESASAKPGEPGEPGAENALEVLPLDIEKLTSDNMRQVDSSAGVVAPTEVSVKMVKPLRKKGKKRQKNGDKKAETATGPAADSPNSLPSSVVNPVQNQSLSIPTVTTTSEAELPPSPEPIPLLNASADPPTKIKKPKKQPSIPTDKVAEVPTSNSETPPAVPAPEPLPTVSKKEQKKVPDPIVTEAQSVMVEKIRPRMSEAGSGIEHGTPLQHDEAVKSKKRKINKEVDETLLYPPSKRSILASPVTATSSGPTVDLEVKAKKAKTKKTKAANPVASSPTGEIDMALDDIIENMKRKGQETVPSLSTSTEPVKAIAAGSLSTTEKRAEVTSEVRPETAEDKKKNAKRRKAAVVEEVQRSSGILDSLSEAVPDSSPTGGGNNQKLTSVSAPRIENLRESGVSMTMQGETSLQNTKERKSNYLGESIGPNETELSRNSKEEHSLNENSKNSSKVSQDQRGSPPVISQDKQGKSSERDELPADVERDTSPHALNSLSVNGDALELFTGDGANSAIHNSADLEEKSASATEVERSLNGDAGELDVGVVKDSSIVSSIDVQEKTGSSPVRDHSQSQPAHDAEESVDDEDIGRTGKQLPVNMPRSSNTHRSLIDIATRRDLFSPAAARGQFPLSPVKSFNQQRQSACKMTRWLSTDDEDSSSSSDSDSDRQFVIPKGRRAGNKQSSQSKVLASIASYIESGL